MNHFILYQWNHNFHDFFTLFWFLISVHFQVKLNEGLGEISYPELLGK